MGWWVKIDERQVDTPTVERLKLGTSQKDGRPYVFVLTDHGLVALRTAGMPLTTVAAYACIKGAVRAAHKHEWVTLTRRTLEAVGRDARWWHEHTQRLERAGFIDCRRHKGRMPCYGLRPDSGAE